MRRVLLLFVAGALLGAEMLCAKENTLSPADAADGWLLLFDGTSSMGWSQGKVSGWRISDGSFVFDGQQNALLGSSVPFADFVLRFDFKAANPAKAADMLIRYARTDTPEDSAYIVKLSTGDANWPVGSVVSVAKADAVPVTANQWHAVEMEANGDSLSVSIDGHKLASGKDARGKAGYIGFLGKAGESMQIRNLRLKPEALQNLFNGSDLSNWRAVGVPPPKPAGGLKKMLKLGSAKPKEAQWNVQSGTIHGEGGQGELQTQSLHGDFLVQLQAREAKIAKDTEALIRLRADAGQWATGYRVDLLPADAGALVDLKAPRSGSPAGSSVLETIAVAGRHFLIWVNGYPVTEFNDSRPEAPSVDKGAKSAPGAIAISTNSSLDVLLAKATDYPAALGVPKTAPAPAPAPVVAVATPTPGPQPAAPIAVPPPAMTPQQLEEEKTKAEVKRLTAQALQENDPQKLVGIYGQILQADPDNSFAAGGLRDAKAKVEQAAAEKRKETEQQAQQQTKAETNEAQGHAALQKAERSFSAGDLTGAAAALAVAERLLPNNSEARKLQVDLNRAVETRHRIAYLAGAGGLLALGGLLVVAFRKRGVKVPVLIVVEGIDKGKKFRLDSEIVHIGAVAQHGNDRNEIVLKDVDRMISRFHCEILNKKGKLFLIDRGSSNGTFVNGKRVPASKPLQLKRGKRFSLAQVCDLEVGWERSR